MLGGATWPTETESTSQKMAVLAGKTWASRPLNIFQKLWCIRPTLIRYGWPLKVHYGVKVVSVVFIKPPTGVIAGSKCLETMSGQEPLNW